jgi:hypothetical protein
MTYSKSFRAYMKVVKEPGWLSRYSDWLLAGGQRGRSSGPGRDKNFLFSVLSRLALRTTQPPIQ